MAPRMPRGTVATQVQRHPGLGGWLKDRADPNTITGLALTALVVLLIAGVGGVGLLLIMVRTHRGFADFDMSAALFGAHHGTAFSTRVLRLLTQLGGSIVLVPLTAAVAIAYARRQHNWRSIVAFLAVCACGQYFVANGIKLVVSRARPDISQLTGFASSSFPSGHATAAAATFAAYALIAGRGHSRSVRAVMGAVAIGLTVMVASSRVLLGVHWLTDVMAGICLGWAWFALCSLAFGGRLLHFGAPVEAAVDAAMDGSIPNSQRTNGRLRAR